MDRLLIRFIFIFFFFLTAHYQVFSEKLIGSVWIFIFSLARTHQRGPYLWELIMSSQNNITQGQIETHLG